MKDIKAAIPSFMIVPSRMTPLSKPVSRHTALISLITMMLLSSNVRNAYTTLAKIPFGSVTVGRKSSVVFHKGSTAKAVGTVKRFARPAELDPENRENTIGFRLYHIIVAYCGGSTCDRCDGKGNQSCSQNGRTCLRTKSSKRFRIKQRNQIIYKESIFTV